MFEYKKELEAGEKTQNCKKNTNTVNQMKKQKSTFKVGDLVWAKLPKFPFWPAIITEENGIAYKIKQTINYYHVTFFGDRVSHCWLKENCLVEFRTNSPFSLIKFEFPKTKAQNLMFYKSINEIRYFTIHKNVKTRLNLLKILKQSYDNGVIFDGFKTKIIKHTSESVKNERGLFNEINKFKACCNCFRSNGKLFLCNGSCNGFYHKKCPIKVLIDKITDSYSKQLANVEEKCNLELKNKFKCTMCTISYLFCLLCYNKNNTTEMLKCSIDKCERYYHTECLNDNPLVQFIFSDYRLPRRFICPVHVCSTCIFLSKTYDGLLNFSHENLVTCIRCPTSYHQSFYCIPAGTLILSNHRIICPKHFNLHPAINKLKSTFILPLPKVLTVSKNVSKLNMNWCLLCSRNGELINCETCPNSFHLQCLNTDPNLKRFKNEYICEHCFDFKYPQYGEIVWVKHSVENWWPGRVLCPDESPNVRIINHGDEFFVKLFALNTIQRCQRKSVFSFTEDDRDDNNWNGLNPKFSEAVELAVNELLKLQNEWNLYHKEVMKKIKLHRMYKNAKSNVFLTEEISRYVEQLVDNNKPLPCYCNKHMMNPCGQNSSCLNRFTNVECQDEFCNAGPLCENRYFSKKMNHKLQLFVTERCGWGIRTLKPLKQNDFIIEYIGEIIDANEFNRRIQFKKNYNETTHYFLKIKSNVYIDAGRRGNLSRFINHSCIPNCEAQIWYVRRTIKGGIFALRDIAQNEELNFNYADEHLTICLCKTKNCSGFLREIKTEKQSKKKFENIKTGKENFKKNSSITKSKKKGQKKKVLNVGTFKKRQVLCESIVSQNNNDINIHSKICKTEHI